MKKIFASVIVVGIIILSVLSVSGASSNVASLELEYSTNENGNIVVSASIIGITEPSGLSAVIYNINTDPTALEYVNANVSLPSSWENLSKDSMYKDAFEAEFIKSPYSDEEGEYIWWVFSALPAEGNGIKQDNEFHIEIEFKPLKNTKTQVSFNCDSLYNDEDVYMENPLNGENKSITIDLVANNNTSSDNDTESDNSSFIDNSVGSDDETSNNSSYENISSEDNGNASVDNSYESDDEPSFNESEGDIEVGDTVSGESTAVESDEISADENSFEFEESFSNGDVSAAISSDFENNNNDDGITILIIILVAVVVIGGLVALIIIKQK